MIQTDQVTFERKGGGEGRGKSAEGRKKWENAYNLKREERAGIIRVTDPGVRAEGVPKEIGS